MSHTPGPWIADTTHPEQSLFVVWAKDLMIADVLPDQHNNEEANARLIAAAPELYAACLALRASLADWIDIQDRDDERNEDDKALEFADAAIAKAEGRTHEE